MRWQLRVTGQAKIRDLQLELPRILGRLARRPDAQELQRLHGLGVTEVAGPWPPGTDESGRIQLLPEGISGPAVLTWEPFLGWITTFLASNDQADVRGKLAATGSAERHVFVGASFTTPARAYFALARELRPELPRREPTLPPQITHLWVWSVTGTERCLAWFPDIGWFDPTDHWATP
jgi:hypothetical protein